MKILLTKSAKPLSVLIRWGLREKCSHFAVSFDDKIVFQSNLKGVHLVGYKHFKESVEVVYCLDYSSFTNLEVEEEIYQAIEVNESKWYDFGAFFYFVYCGLKFRFFGLPLPKRNLWGSSDSFLCAELADKLPDWIFPRDPNFDLGMTSPEMLYPILKAQHDKLILKQGEVK